MAIDQGVNDIGGAGYGGFYNGEGYGGLFSPEQLSLWTHINLLELFALVNHVHKFGHAWRGMQVHLGSDNQATVEWVNRWTAKPPESLALIKQLWFTCQQFDILLKVEYVPGKLNILADACSRQQWEVFESALQDWMSEHNLLTFSD